MTRNQTLGIPAKFLDAQFPESSWGLGWSIHSRKTGYCGALYSDNAYEHWGAGGIYFMVDPDRDLLAVFLSSVPYGRPDAAAWRYLAAVAAGACTTAREQLRRDLPAASPYFPAREAQSVMDSCSSTAALN
jgi:CubicO group peptidase (beta-lactamase class C family)